MKLVFHTEMLPRVMLRHMYNFSNLLPSFLCSVKFSGQAHSPPNLKPPPAPSSNHHPIHTSSLESLAKYITLSCSRVNDKSVGKRERRKFRYRGNNVTGPLLTPTHTEWFRIPSFGKRRPRLVPTQFAKKYIYFQEHHV